AEGLARMANGSELIAEPQSEHGVTYAHKLDKAEALLDWNEPANVLERKVRAFDPWPVAEARLNGETLRIWKALALPSQKAPSEQASSEQARAGSVVAAGRAGIDVACADGVLRLLE